MIWLVFTLGLLVGFLGGVVGRDAFDLYRDSRKERTMNDKHSGGGANIFLTVLLGVVVAAQLFVGVLLIDSRRDLADSERNASDFAACNVRWQQEFAAAYQARVKASTDVTEALERVVRAVDAQDQSEFRDAVDAYIEVRDRQDREVDRNQYPPLPSELCGEAP